MYFLNKVSVHRHEPQKYLLALWHINSLYFINSVTWQSRKPQVKKIYIIPPAKGSSALSRTPKDLSWNPQSHWNYPIPSEWSSNCFLWRLMVSCHVPRGGKTRLFGNGKNSIYVFIRASAILSLYMKTTYTQFKQMPLGVPSAMWPADAALTSLPIFLHTIAAIVKFSESSCQLIDIITESVEKQVI